MAEGREPSLEGYRLLVEIGERGYAEFDHQIPDDMIEELVDVYADFTLAHPDPEAETMSLMLPPDSDELYKQLDDLERGNDQQAGWHKYRTNAVGVGKPNGYTNRSFQERALLEARGFVIPAEDPKEFYHYTPVHFAAMIRNHQEFGWGKLPEEVLRLERAFRPIHAKAAQLMVKIVGLIEEVHPEVRDYFDPPSLNTSPLRLLFYHPAANTTPPGEVTSEDMLGAGHYDKAGWTTQLAESHLGLRVSQSGSETMDIVIRSQEKAVVFPGLGIAANFGQDTPFQPGWHDIVKTSDLNAGRSVPDKAREICERWALIFFANGSGYKDPDKDLSHTRAS